MKTTKIQYGDEIYLVKITNVDEFNQILAQDKIKDKILFDYASLKNIVW
jgi:hypothetical protein